MGRKRKENPYLSQRESFITRETRNALAHITGCRTFDAQASPVYLKGSELVSAAIAAIPGATDHEVAALHAVCKDTHPELAKEKVWAESAARMHEPEARRVLAIGVDRTHHRSIVYHEGDEAKLRWEKEPIHLMKTETLDGGREVYRVSQSEASPYFQPWGAHREAELHTLSCSIDPKTGELSAEVVDLAIRVKPVVDTQDGEQLDKSLSAERSTRKSAGMSREAQFALREVAHAGRSVRVSPMPDLDIANELARDLRLSKGLGS